MTSLVDTLKMRFPESSAGGRRARRARRAAEMLGFLLESRRTALNLNPRRVASPVLLKLFYFFNFTSLMLM